MGANGTYFLPYDLSSARSAAGNELTVTRGGSRRATTLGSGFYPHRYSASATATGDLVFAHFGSARPRLATTISPAM